MIFPQNTYHWHYITYLLFIYPLKYTLHAIQKFVLFTVESSSLRTVPGTKQVLNNYSLKEVISSFKYSIFLFFLFCNVIHYQGVPWYAFITYACYAILYYIRMFTHTHAHTPIGEVCSKLFTDGLEFNELEDNQIQIY